MKIERLRRWILTTLIAGAALCLPASAQAQPVDFRTEFVLREMESIIRPGVQPTSGLRVFVRMYDTHSSIHAHWAAYRIARAIPAVQAIALESESALLYHKVRHEIANHINYTYARAWFLLLATEYEKWAIEAIRPDPYRLRPLADKVAQDLLDHYATSNIVPTSSDYDSASWALTQLHQYLDHVGRFADLLVVDGWIAQHFLIDIVGTGFGGDLNSHRFFSTFGNWHHLVHTTQSPASIQAFWQLQDAIPNSHLAVNDLGLVHSYGLSWSRLWALRDMAATAPTQADRDRFRRSADVHLARGMQRHYILKGNFVFYDHWVCQFAVYAVTEGLGF